MLPVKALSVLQTQCVVPGRDCDNIIASFAWVQGPATELQIVVRGCWWTGGILKSTVQLYWAELPTTL